MNGRLQNASTAYPIHGECASLLAWVREREAEVRAHLRRLFPDVSLRAGLRVLPLAVETSHLMAVVEADDGSGRRLLIKGRGKHNKIGQSSEIEMQILSEVAPKIWADNGAVRCPQLLAYYPDQEILLMEMVEGLELYSLLCGLGHSRDRRTLSRLMELCGEWLARLHALTQSSEEGNPFEWLAEKFGREKTQRVFARCDATRSYDQVRSLLDKLCDRYRSFRKKLCTVHGEFSPYHVLVKDDSIYVIDLASSRQGYLYADLAHFTTFYDAMPAWRRIMGGLRLDLEEQKRLFLRAYFSHAPSLLPPETIVMHLARLEAMVTFVRRTDGADTLRSVLYSHVAGLWLPQRFRTACRVELRGAEDAARQAAGTELHDSWRNKVGKNKRRRSSKPRPTVSVVIPTHNTGHFIEPAIESIFQQTFEDFEIIVVDDGSTDGTEKRLEKYESLPGFSYVRQEKRGSGTARNRGIECARGEFIAFLDADDLWLPQKLELQVKLMQSEPSLGLICTNFERFDESGAARPSGLDLDLLTKRQDLFRQLLRRLFVLTSTVLAPRSVFKRVGGFDKGLEWSQDRDLFIRIARHYPIKVIPQILVRYRRHSSNVSNRFVERSMLWNLVIYERLRSGAMPLSREELLEVEVFLRNRYRQLARFRLGRGDRLGAREMLWGLARLKPADPEVLLYPLTYLPTGWIKMLRGVYHAMPRRR